MPKHFMLYCDESESRGEFYSNFYGAGLVRSNDFEEVKRQLTAAKEFNNLHMEVKWSKVTGQYLEKYTNLIDAAFDLIARDKLKIRIMFTQNARVASDPIDYRVEYHKLYYHFIKLGLGLVHANPRNANGVAVDTAHLSIFFDQLPAAAEQCAEFKAAVCSLERYKEFRKCRLRIPAHQIAEVESHKHVILQVVDLLLGAVNFKLNELPTDSKRGQAKETLQRHIYRRICEIHPNFNYGQSTSVRGDPRNEWSDPYRHFLFMPKRFELDRSKTKAARDRARAQERRGRRT